MVFCLLACGMQSAAFAPENLTQICVCTKGSKDLIIFWELYYLSFANQVILQTEKMLCMTQPRLLLNGVDSRPETQNPARRPEHVQKVSWRKAVLCVRPACVSLPYAIVQAGRVTKSNAYLTLVDRWLHWTKWDKGNLSLLTEIGKAESITVTRMFYDLQRFKMCVSITVPAAATSVSPGRRM